MEGMKARALMMMRNNEICSRLGCTLASCSDLRMYQGLAANRNAPFQERTKQHGTKSHALWGRLLYWQKRMHVPRLALQVNALLFERPRPRSRHARFRRARSLNLARCRRCATTGINGGQARTRALRVGLCEGTILKLAFDTTGCWCGGARAWWLRWYRCSCRSRG